MGKITKRISTYWTGMGLLVRVRQGAHEPDREGEQQEEGTHVPLPVCHLSVSVLVRPLTESLLGSY